MRKFTALHAMSGSGSGWRSPQVDPIAIAPHIVSGSTKWIADLPEG